MSVEKALGLGLAGNEISKKITGRDDVSAGRTVVAAGAGATLGAVAAGALVVSGVVAAPVTIPLAVGAAIVSGIASLFD
jgi:predicted nicotinamide N-methyase